MSSSFIFLFITVLNWAAGLAFIFPLVCALLSRTAWKAWVAPEPKLREERRIVQTVLMFALLDWTLLALLPRLGLSYGPVSQSLVAITSVRLAAFLCAALVGLVWKRLGRPDANPAFNLSWTLNLGFLGCLVYGLYIEPFALQTTRLQVDGPAFLPGRPLRIAQLSDIHIERITRRERQMLADVQALQPDLIVLTGDYLNIDHTSDPIARREVVQILSQLSAPYGIYAISGTPAADTPDTLQEVFSQLPNITLLQDQVKRLDLPGDSLYLLGVSNLKIGRDSVALHSLMQSIPPDAYSVLLYHTPGLPYEAAEEQVDLYLTGHTHGGQARLPLYGALTTMSRHGREFQAGLYQIGQTQMYISRGIGMEGLQLPRVRFLCPPEIVLIEIQ